MFFPHEIHFSISQLSFCHRILYLYQLFSISVVSTWLQGKCGKRRVFSFLPPVTDSKFLLGDAHGILLLSAEFWQV